jgi:hypothetical protein
MTQSHQSRIQASVRAFQTASDTLVGALDRLNDDVATRSPQGGGWTAAQIGWHVATTNDFLAGLITGAIPHAVPVPAGFEENPAVFSNLPAKVETFAALVPPATATRAEAIGKMRKSTADTIQAIEGLTPERASGYAAKFPFGLVSLYQVADFIGGHVVRHQAQLERAISPV